MTVIPKWRQTCFSTGLILLGLGMMINFAMWLGSNGTANFTKTHIYATGVLLGAILLICASVLCLFGQGRLRFVLAVAASFLAVIALLGG